VSTLHARWLGRVAYDEADALQRALHEHGVADHLLLLEHPHVYTLGSSGRREHVLVDPTAVGAQLVHADRGGDVTYHGPGQLVGYPIMSLDEWRAGQRDVVAYVRRLEDVLVAALGDLGIAAGRLTGYPGVWVGDEKIAAIGVRVARGRTRHGFALNVQPDLAMFSHIVPCGITDRGVTSITRVLGHEVAMRDVVDRVAVRFAEAFGHDSVERQDVVWRTSASDLAPFTRDAAAAGPGARGEPVRLLGRLAEAGVDAADAVDGSTRQRPPWMRVRARFDDGYLEVKRLARGLALHTVCEEAGCPNIYECWADRTATFMILGDRCTRACGFCLVDTRKPHDVDADEPRRVAAAVRELGLEHAVITCVARDDLDDGGAAVFAATVERIRAERAAARVELLISDCGGDERALATIFGSCPDVLAHNLETVARLQRAARPSAGYARSLAVLGRAKRAGLVTKSSLVLGMGETAGEIRGALTDLRSVGVDIVTLGQYLRPSDRHLPVVRWWTPDGFGELAAFATSLGFVHVEAGPLVRSSYHAKRAVDAAGAPRLVGATPS